MIKFILRLRFLGSMQIAPNFVILKFAEFQKFLRLQKLGKFKFAANFVILKLPEKPSITACIRQIFDKFQFILRLQKLGKNLCKPKIIILKISEIQGTLRLQILGKTKILNQIYAKIVKMEVLWITKLPKDYRNCIRI